MNTKVRHSPTYNGKYIHLCTWEIKIHSTQVSRIGRLPTKSCLTKSSPRYHTTVSRWQPQRAPRHSLIAVEAKGPLSVDSAVLRSGYRLAGIRHQRSEPLNTESSGCRCQESMFEQQVLIKYQKKITGFEYCIKIHLF